MAVGCDVEPGLTVSRKVLWFALQLVLLMSAAQATSRRLNEEQDGATGVRLKAYYDPGCHDARHAPPVKSFLVSDGSWVDCIPVEGQIAAHHPLLKDHVIQLTPPRGARRTASESHPQAFAREHGGCPENTIPVLRDDPTSKLKKKVALPVSRSTSDPVDPDAGVGTHEYAVTGLQPVPSAYSGAASVFSLNGPTLGSADEFSLSQFWIIDGADANRSTIEVGWQTQPFIHQNDLPYAPHLFVFWTNNNYVGGASGGSCYNLGCPGFVQVPNSSWVIGGAMPYYTTLAQNASTEYSLPIQVQYNSGDGNWWLYLAGEAVGYWPSSIYINGYMQGTASLVQWGGEVYFPVVPGQTNHSTTAMGSGAFADAGWPTAAFHANISYFDATGNLTDPGAEALDAARIFNNPLCYDIQVQQNGYTNWGTYFFFGGPGGGNPDCHY